MRKVLRIYCVALPCRAQMGISDMKSKSTPKTGRAAAKKADPAFLHITAGTLGPVPIWSDETGKPCDQSRAVAGICAYYGLTALGLAEHLAISARTVQGWRIGRPVHLVTLYRLAQLLQRPDAIRAGPLWSSAPPTPAARAPQAAPQAAPKAAPKAAKKTAKKGGRK